jgi:putrescine aminotransferase
VRDILVMSPPLIITHDEIDRLVDTIAAALDAAAPRLRAIS